MSAGTVSRILWHFTGGPEWDSNANCQKAEPKDPAKAYAAMRSILDTATLRLGSYREVVKVKVAKMFVRDRDDKTKGTFRTNHPVELKSQPVCCLADIPIMHLSYHAKRYGQMAIGFHRQAAITHGFNPVFYTLHTTDALRALHTSIAELNGIYVDAVKDGASAIESSVSDIRCEKGHEVDLDVSTEISSLESTADSIESAVDDAVSGIENFLAFVKTFDESELNTIYCEREWRATKAFKFRPANIAMVVLPRKGGYYDKFLAEFDFQKSLHTTVPVVPWEDLIEH